MDLVFLLKYMMGLYDLDLSYSLVSADSSTCKYNLRHTNYQFKIRYARTKIFLLLQNSKVMELSASTFKKN